MNRPYTVPGFGWIIAIVVVFVCILGVLGALAITPTLMLFMILGLALAILL